ncbi:MAG: thiol protease/hemagglutinin PrtT [Muribaculaceae bacterium]|nr:thiol protease/hemagglutinin PrtT [Muribaculaceae bacterium]
MRKLPQALTALFITVGSFAAVYAAPLTPEGALKRALSAGSQQVSGQSTSHYTLSLTAEEVYVFSRSAGGYLVLPSDDNAPAVLGYSDSGNFSASSMPPAMKWWLGEYSRQIRAGGSSTARIASPARQAIGPLCSTQWNQDAPYNNMCPTVGVERSMTGCAATALAQVMKYHNWPQQGKGSNSYSWNGTTISLDFSRVSFDWQNMLDRYGSSATSAQQQAVAQLMYACGVSIDMDYSPSSSGATDVVIPAAMVNYFNYDAGIRYYSHDYYGIDEWNDLIYSQLSEYGPVQYSGQSNDGGHSFVCDGYSNDGYFHINWGWGGMSDGYFLLTALDPGQQGIGGSTSGFNYYQSVIGCVRKPVSGSRMYLNLLMEGSFAVQQSSARLGSSVYVSGLSYNFSTGSVSGTLGVKAVNDATGAIQYFSGQDVSNLAPLSGFSGYSFALPSTLSAGEYTLTPAVRDTDGSWLDIPVKISGSRSVSMRVSGTTAYFTNSEAPSVYATDLEMQSDLYIGEKFRMTATVSNPGTTEYYGTLVPGLANSRGSVVAIGGFYPVDIAGGASETMDYVGTFSSTDTSDFQAGTYTLYLFDTNTGRPVSEGISVRLNATPSSTSLNVTSFRFAGDANAANPDNLQFTGTLQCSNGYFGGALSVAIFPYTTSGASAIAVLNTEPIFISGGQSASFTATGVLTEAEAGKRYMAAVFDGKTQMSSVVIFTIDSNSGVITAPISPGVPEVYPTLTYGTVYVKGEDITQVKVYSPAGALLESSGATDSIDLSKFAPGMYLIEVDYGSASTQRIINRVIRR